MLKDKDLEVRQATALSLATIQPQTAELPAVLMELSKDQDIFISGAAIAALRASHPALAHTMGLR